MSRQQFVIPTKATDRLGRSVLRGGTCCSLRRQKVVISGLLVGPARVLHHPRRWTPIQQFASHEFHVGRDVMKELFVSSAKVVQPGFAVRRTREPVLRAFSIAGKADIAIAAVSG